MRVTTKGQVTIPQEVRERLGIVPGTEVDFVLNGNSASLVKAKKNDGKLSRGEQIVARATGTGTANTDLTTDQILAWTRGWDDIDDPDR
jgi:AbrB family looped-hinge helix DNA binding protein